MSSPSHRMLNLLSVLQSRRDWAGQELADRLGVTVRTVRRDVDRLRELGYAITAVKGPYGGYRLAPGEELPPLLFDDEQAVAIAVALQSASGVDIADAAARALATMRQVMPSHLRHRIDGIRFEADAAGAQAAPAVVAAMSAAARDHRTLRIEYRDDGRSRRIEPNAVVVRDGRWYVVAWDGDAADWRILRLDRVRVRQGGGVPFEPREIPTGDARTYLSARSKGSGEQDRWPVTADLILSTPAQRVVPFLGDAELEDLGDGRSRVRVGSWSWAGALAWALRFDVPFEVIGPPELAEAARALAVRLSDSAAGPGIR
ncbi:helix-turn-helix transcriptional regulator [Microbacterium oleivorans]|uniref:Transcriptional regulator n=1 Tax=Microbacterium oleivorans TaxID=273677 RepID=A0A177KAI0_9MICO|nr:WYL domain-containing protein [Microbacterium oleivorans]OAH50418.1 transcriptional regulator [Microbacterium oleivorans]